jgi:Fe-S-cluster containining protein
MENKKYEPEVINKLDLKKYGLSYLEGRNILTLTGSDMDRLLIALGNDDIALDVPIPCTPENVQKVLSYSECRRCGKCCIPNPLNPGSPGVEIFEEELNAVANYLQLPYETLEEKTSVGKAVPHPFQRNRLVSTRWLPLPCPFFVVEENKCQVYPVRPVVCKIHPIIFTGDYSFMSVKVNCDYGKDLIIGAFRYVRTSGPHLEIKL